VVGQHVVAEERKAVERPRERVDRPAAGDRRQRKRVVQVRLVRDVLAEPLLAAALKMHGRRDAIELRRHSELPPFEPDVLHHGRQLEQRVRQGRPGSSSRNAPPPPIRSALSPTRSRSARSEVTSTNGPSSPAITSSALREPEPRRSGAASGASPSKTIN